VARAEFREASSLAATFERRGARKEVAPDERKEATLEWGRLVT
jgi:hypothetical protein